MSKTDGQPRGRPPHRSSTSKKVTPFEPDDWQPTYTRSQLIRFDNRFRARMLAAFRKGTESRVSAAGLRTVAVAGDTPFYILTAKRRANRYQDVAEVTTSVP
jgi:hypothetical protein